MSTIRTQESNVVEDAKNLFFSGEIEDAQKLLSQYVSDRQSQDVHQSYYRMTQTDEVEESVFSACCVSASIAAMQGKIVGMGGVPDPFKEIESSTQLSPIQQAMKMYVEGTALLQHPSRRESAKIRFTEALRVEPCFVVAHIGLGAAHFAAKNYRESFTSFATALKDLGSTSAPSIVRVGLALSAYYLDMVDRAKDILERALEFNSDDALAMMALVVVYLRKMDLEMVTKLMTKLYKLLPDDVTVCQKFVDLLYFKAVQQKNAKATFNTINELIATIREKSELSMEQRAYCDFQEGRMKHAMREFEEAEVLYRKALDTETGMPKLHACSINLSTLLMQMGREKECRSVLNKLKVHCPNERQVLEMLTVLTSRRGEHAEAIQHASRLAQSVAPGSRDAWELLAWSCRLDKETCLVILKHCLEMFSQKESKKNWRIRVNIAALEGNVTDLMQLAHQQLGKNLEKVLSGRISKDHVALVYNAALCLEMSSGTTTTTNNNNMPAEKLYIALIKQYPTFPDPYIRLCRICTESGNTHQAAKWLTLLQRIQSSSNNSSSKSIATTTISGMYYEQGSLSNAIDVLKTTEKSVLAGLAQGTLLLKKAEQVGTTGSKHLERAADRFAFVLKKDPANLLAAHGCICCIGMEEATVAHTCLERVREVTPCSPYLNPSIDSNMSNLLMRSGSFSAAIHSLTKAGEMARVQDAANKVSSPGKTFLDYLSSEQASALAACLCCEKRYDEAADAYRNVLNRPETNADSKEMETRYNIAIALFGSILHAIGDEDMPAGLEVGVGKKLRGQLAEALTHAEIVAQNKTAAATGGMIVFKEARVFLKTAVSALSKKLDRKLQQLVQFGQHEKKYSSVQAERWAAVAKADTEHELQAEAERKRTEEEEKVLQREADAQLFEQMQRTLEPWKVLAGAAAMGLGGEERGTVDILGSNEPMSEDDEYMSEGIGQVPENLEENFLFADPQPVKDEDELKYDKDDEHDDDDEALISGGRKRVREE